MLDEFSRLVCTAWEEHRSLPAFGQELIEVLACHAQPIDMLHEDEQKARRSACFDKFCQQWKVEAGWLEQIIALYLPEARTDIGHEMRSILADLASSCVIQLPRGAEAVDLRARRQAKTR